jgi:hypothetical protein
MDTVKAKVAINVISGDLSKKFEVVKALLI